MTSKGKLAAGEFADVAAADGTVCADHHGIPRDADGAPIFLILPPGVLRSYQRKMRPCERGWRERQDPAAVAQAIVHVFLFRQVLPAWLADAVQVLAYSKRTDHDTQRARNAAVRLARFQAVRDFMYKIVDGRAAKRTAADVKRDRDAALCRAIDALMHKVVDGRRIELTDAEVKRDPDRAKKLARLKRQRRDLAATDCERPTWVRAYEHAARVLANTPASGEPLTMKAAYEDVARDLKDGRRGEYFMARPNPNKSVARSGEPLRVSNRRKCS
jgi:hypothetical protein